MRQSKTSAAASRGDNAWENSARKSLADPNDPRILRDALLHRLTRENTEEIGQELLTLRAHCPIAEISAVTKRNLYIVHVIAKTIIDCLHSGVDPEQYILLFEYLSKNRRDGLESDFSPLVKDCSRCTVNDWVEKIKNINRISYYRLNAILLGSTLARKPPETEQLCQELAETKAKLASALAEIDRLKAALEEKEKGDEYLQAALTNIDGELDEQIQAGNALLIRMNAAFNKPAEQRQPTPEAPPPPYAATASASFHGPHHRHRGHRGSRGSREAMEAMPPETTVFPSSHFKPMMD